MAILANTLAHRGHFDRAFAILEGAQALPKKNAFDFSILSNHRARAHLFQGDVDAAEPILRAAIEHATRVGLEFTLPWHQALLGYTHALKGEFEIAVPHLETALERSKEIHLPYLTSSTAARLGETLAPRDSKRALDVAETALGVARAKGFRALETELLRVKASALFDMDADAAEDTANEGYALAQELDLGPEQAHGLRTLGDIMAAKGARTKAAELHGLALAKYRSLGMTRWAEGAG
jgi:tetratricopeptide (TPR) repeat protein